MKFLKILSVLLALMTAVCGQADRMPKAFNTGAGLTVEYIANEGILIKSGSKTILLDAIHRS